MWLEHKLLGCSPLYYESIIGIRRGDTVIPTKYYNPY